MRKQQSIRISVKAVIVQEGRILLIGYDLDDGSEFHYNLPGGGVKIGEGLHEALKREVREEAGAEIDVGPLLFVSEYVPAQQSSNYGPTQSLQLFFRCALRPDSSPEQPPSPIDDQAGVFWLPLSELHSAPLLPPIGKQLQAAFVDSGPAADPFVANWQELCH